MTLRLALLFILLVQVGMTHAQLGGSAVNTILEIPSSARVSSLGGNQIAVMDNDLNLGVYNPALLNPLMSNQVAFSYLDWFSDINMGFASYSKHFDSLKTTFAATVLFADYGSFIRTDPTGTELGSFRAGDYSLGISAGHQIDTLFSVGAGLKYIYSSYDTYTSSGVALDLGGIYTHPNKLFTVAAMIRNIGYQVDGFTDEREDLPLNIQLGTTYKFKYAPFRLGLILDNLQKWDLTFEDPNDAVQIDPTTGEVIQEEFTTLDKALRHVIINNEIILSDNFNIRVGYNFRRRAELAFDTKPGGVGLTYGVGLRLSKFHISYGRASYHLAGASNTFTIALRFQEFNRSSN
jgi:hypothetical protein